MMSSCSATSTPSGSGRSCRTCTPIPSRPSPSSLCSPARETSAGKNARRPQTVSLDSENDEGHSLYDILAEAQPDEGGSQYAAQYADLLKVLTRRQKAALAMKANGCTSSQIGRALGIPTKSADGLTYRAKAKVLRAERDRSERLRAVVQQRTGREIPREDFKVMEQTARRRLALYKTRHPKYTRQESALPKIIAGIAADCGGGVLITAYS